MKALFLLSLRRGLGLWPWLLAFFLLNELGTSSPGQLELGAGSEVATSNLRRHSIWLGGGLLVLLLTALQLGALPGRWRRAESLWLVPRKRSLAASLLVSFGGRMLALSVFLLLLAAWAELRSPATQHAYAHHGRMPAHSIEWVGEREGSAVRWSIEDPEAPPGTLGRFFVRARTWEGPTADIAFSARRLEGGAETRIERRIDRGAQLELELPPGEGRIELALERRGEGALLALEGPDCELLIPVESGRLASLHLLLHLLLAGVAWSALALGLGCWMSSFSAVLTPLALYLASWTSLQGLPALLPGAGLPEAYRWLGKGVVPAAVEPASLGLLLLTAALGLGLASLGLRGRSYGP